MTHATGTAGFDAWYKDAFLPFQKDALHSGEGGGPEFGPSFAKVFDVMVYRGRDGESERCAVAFVHPPDVTETLGKFFVDEGKGANPFWQIGRDAGWLSGPVTTWQSSTFLFRGVDPKTGFPPDLKKGQGVMIAAAGVKLDIQREWVPSFTSPETDALHDGAGVFTSAAGNLVRKYSDYPAGKYKAVCVWHAFKNVNQAKAFDAKFRAANEPPFDDIAQITENFQSFPFEVVADTFYPEYLPTDA